MQCEDEAESVACRHACPDCAGKCDRPEMHAGSGRLRGWRADKLFNRHILRYFRGATLSSRSQAWRWKHVLREGGASVCSATTGRTSFTLCARQSVAALPVSSVSE